MTRSGLSFPLAVIAWIEIDGPSMRAAARHGVLPAERPVGLVASLARAGHAGADLAVRPPQRVRSVVGDVEDILRGVDGDAVRIAQSGIVSLQQPQRCVILVRVLAEHDDGRIVLRRQEHLVAPVVDRDTEGAVGRLEGPDRRVIARAAMPEHHEGVHGVVVRGEDVAGRGVDVDARLELDQRVAPGEHALGRRDRVRGGVVETVVRQHLEEVFIRQNDLVPDRIDRDGGECRVSILNLARRRAGEDLRLIIQRLGAGAPSLPTGLFGPLDGRGPDADVRRQRIHAYEAAVNRLGADRVRVDLRHHQARADNRA